MKTAILPAALLAASATAASADGFYWQHLDPDPRPFAVGAMFTSDTEFEGYGVTDVVEAFFESNFLPIEDFLFGELELGIWAHAYGFVDNPNMKAVPHALLDASFNAGYVLRFDNGWAWRLWARPGVYADPSAPAFGCPAGLSFFFTATDELSFELGGTVRPGGSRPRAEAARRKQGGGLLPQHERGAVPRRPERPCAETGGDRIWQRHAPARPGNAGADPAGSLSRPGFARFRPEAPGNDRHFGPCRQ